MNNDFKRIVKEVQKNTRNRLLKKDPKFFDKYDIKEYPNGMDYIKTKKGEFVEWVRTPLEMRTLGLAGKVKKVKKKKTSKKAKKRSNKKAKKRSNKKAKKKRKKKRNTMKKRRKI